MTYPSPELVLEFLEVIVPLVEIVALTMGQGGRSNIVTPNRFK